MQHDHSTTRNGAVLLRARDSLNGISAKLHLLSDLFGDLEGVETSVLDSHKARFGLYLLLGSLASDIEAVETALDVAADGAD